MQILQLPITNFFIVMTISIVYQLNKALDIIRNIY